MKQHNPAGSLARQLTRLNQTTNRLARQQMGEKHKIYPVPIPKQKRRQK